MMSEVQFIRVAHLLWLLPEHLAMDVFELLDYNRTGLIGYDQFFIVVAFSLSAMCASLLQFWFRHRDALLLMLRVYGALTHRWRMAMLATWLGLDGREVEEAVEQLLSEEPTDDELDMLYYTLFSDFDRKDALTPLHGAQRSRTCCACSVH